MSCNADPGIGSKPTLICGKPVVIRVVDAAYSRTHLVERTRILANFACPNVPRRLKDTAVTTDTPSWTMLDPRVNAVRSRTERRT